MQAFSLVLLLAASACAAPTHPLVQLVLNVNKLSEVTPIEDVIAGAPAVVLPEVPESIILPGPATPEVVIPESVVLPAPATPEVILTPEAVALPAPATPEVILTPEAVALPTPATPEVVVTPEGIVLPGPATPEVIEELEQSPEYMAVQALLELLQKIKEDAREAILNKVNEILNKE